MRGYMVHYSVVQPWTHCGLRAFLAVRTLVCGRAPWHRVGAFLSLLTDGPPHPQFQKLMGAGERRGPQGKRR